LGHELRLAPWNEYTGPDDKLKLPEKRFASEVLKGLTILAAFDEVSNFGKLLLVEHSQVRGSRLQVSS